MESRGTITTSNYKGVSAEIVYDNNQLIFSTKPGWVSIAFGIIGEALASSKERFRISIVDVISLTTSETWSGKLVYELTLNNNDVCKIVFKSNDELTLRLKNDLRDRGVVEK